MNDNYEYKLSIVIAAYNIEEYINFCVDSVINAFDNQTEIIVVNDGSKDNTLSKLQKYNDVKNVVIVDQKNQGLSAVRNNGLKIAKGKYIVFVDGDDYVDSKAGEYLYSFIDKNYDIVVSDYIYDRAGEYSNVDALNGIQNTNNKDEYFVKKMYKSTIQRYMVKTSLLKKYDILFPLGLLHEDMYWGSKIADLISTNKLSTYYNTDKLWYYYRKDREGSIMTVKLRWKNLLSMIKINIMLNDELKTESLILDARESLFCTLAGFYNKDNPQDKVDEIIKLANDNKFIFKTHNIKYIPFYLTVKCLGFKFAMKLWKIFIVN